MQEARIEIDFVQDNHSLSAKLGALHGLNFQAPPHAQAKLVRCGRDALYVVAIDIRRGSSIYSEWVGVDPSFENRRQLLEMIGFLHGFVIRSRDTEIIYKCSNYYSSECDGTVHGIAVESHLGVDAVDVFLSGKDAKVPALADFDSPFVWEGAT